MTPDLVTELLRRFDALDAALVSKKWPALSPWWRDRLAAFLRSGCRQLVLRVGRRGGKSSSLARLAVALALFCPFDVPPGDVGWVVFVSTSRDEAAQRLRTIRDVLTAVGVPHRAAGDTIELDGRRIGFRVLTCSVGGVSGWTSVLVIGDEVSKWTNGDGVHNAREVLAAIRPTLASMKLARMVLSSSPMGLLDAHAEAFDRGNDAFQMVAHGATWEANPTITEAETRLLESHDGTWAREYAALPSADAVGALDVEALRRCIRPLSPQAEPVAGPELLIDSSGGKCDAFVVLGVQWVVEPSSEPPILMLDALDPRTGAVSVKNAVPDRDDDGNEKPNPAWHPPAQRLALVGLHAWEGDIATHMTTGDVADEVTRIARRLGATRVWGDQYLAWSWQSEFQQRGLRFVERAWTNPAKVDAVARLRQWIREGVLVIPPEVDVTALVAEAATFEQRILPSGGVAFAGRGRSHDDRIMALLLGARLDADGELRGSPLRRASTRVDW